MNKPIVTHQIGIDRAAQMLASVDASAQTAYIAIRVGRLVERIAHLEAENNQLRTAYNNQGAQLDKALNRIDELEARNV